MPEMDFSFDPDMLINVGVGFLIFLIVYFFFLVRALIEMIRLDASAVMIVFTYISLIPFPLFLFLGILNLIIWHFVRMDMMAARDPGT